jgi:hypothetical protein
MSTETWQRKRRGKYESSYTKVPHYTQRGSPRLDHELSLCVGATMEIHSSDDAGSPGHHVTMFLLEINQWRLQAAQANVTKCLHKCLSPEVILPNDIRHIAGTTAELLLSLLIVDSKASAQLSTQGSTAQADPTPLTPYLRATLLPTYMVDYNSDKVQRTRQRASKTSDNCLFNSQIRMLASTVIIKRQG